MGLVPANRDIYHQPVVTKVSKKNASIEIATKKSMSPIDMKVLIDDPPESILVDSDAPKQM